MLGKAGKNNMEAPGGIEPPMKVLQTLALPLGYGANPQFFIERSFTCKDLRLT